MTVGSPHESRVRAAKEASLAATRDARAVAPRPDAEALRSAYLDLLKLSLCDLAGASTQSVGRLEDGLIWTFELTREHQRLRTAGMDWPLQGLTMIGVTRLDDLQSCVESVVRDGVAGDLIEAGTWRGGASILMRTTLDSLGAQERTVWVADSFQGFPTPAPEDDRDDLTAVDFLAVSLEEVRDNFARFGAEDGVRFVPGFFEETLPRLAGGPWSLVRVDADSYAATRLALEHLYPALSTGGYVIIDDYGTLEECRRAVDEFREEHAIGEPLEEIDYTCVRWRCQGAPIEGPPTRLPEGAAARPGGRSIARSPSARIPTYHELNLKLEIEQLRARVGELEGKTGSPQHPSLRALMSGLRRRLGRVVRRAPR